MYIYNTRLASKEIFLPSNQVHREVGRAKNLSAPRYAKRNVCVLNGLYVRVKEANKEEDVGMHLLVFQY